MIDSNDKYTGTGLTVPIALLLAAFVVSPVALFVAEPTGFVNAPVAVTCSLLCMASAHLYWKKYSNRTIPSLETQRTETK